MSYFTILDIIESGNYVKHELNSVTESMELVTSDYEFISYDSEKTFSMKASYASEMCMRGYMWWAVDLIDEAFILKDGSPIISPTSKEPTFSPTPKEITPAPTLIVPTTKAPFILKDGSPTISPAPTVVAPYIIIGAIVFACILLCICYIQRRCIGKFFVEVSISIMILVAFVFPDYAHC